LHDIRRSVATGMAEIGTQPYVVEAVLNHVSGHKAGVAGIYNRSQYAGEKRAALKAWADHISSVIASKPAPRTGNGGVYYGEYSGVRGAVLSRSTKAAARR